MNEHGLTKFTTETEFMESQGRRRDEAAKFFVQYAKLLGKTTYIKTAKQCSFSDINDSWPDLKDIVVESCRLGLFQGSKGKFNPKNQLTNAEAITVLVRLLAWIQSEIWVGHRATNYYTKANELGILQNVEMNIKESVATRGNVGVIIYNVNKMQWQNLSWQRYNSSLWFSLMLPWACTDWSSQWWYETSEIHWMENLNYWTNNDKSIECFIPNKENVQDILELMIHNYECDNELTWQEVQFGWHTFTLYITQIFEWRESKCYKTTYNNQTIRFNFVRWYNDNIIQEILWSLDDPK